MMTDPIADMLTRIRNAVRAGKETVEMPSSHMKRDIAGILADEGYILGSSVSREDTKETLQIRLKFGPDGESAIHELARVSTPGRRVYAGREGIPKVTGGLGISIVSTSKGVMTDRRCREVGVGGEVLCNVW